MFFKGKESVFTKSSLVFRDVYDEAFFMGTIMSQKI